MSTADVGPGLLLATYHIISTSLIPTDEESTSAKIHQAFDADTDIYDTSSMAPKYESLTLSDLAETVSMSTTATSLPSASESNKSSLELPSTSNLDTMPSFLLQQQDASTCTFNEQSSMLMKPTSTSQEASCINAAASRKLVAPSTSELVELETFSSTTPASISTTMRFMVTVFF